MLISPGFLALLLLAQSSADDTVRIPLGLGPTIPLVKGDAGTEGDITLEKRGLSEEFKAVETDLKGFPGQGYSFKVGLGTPKQYVDLLIDTGSSNLAVAGTKVIGLSTFFNPANSSTFRSLNRLVYVPYTLGSWSGTLGSDIVYLAFMPAGKKEFRVELTPITQSSQFFIAGATWQGIVGLAFQSLARPSGAPAKPFFDSLVEATKVPNKFSTLLCGSSEALLKRKQMAESGDVLEAIRKGDAGLRVKANGEFVVGADDANLYTGKMLYSPIRRKWYYELVLTGMRISGSEVMSDCKEYNFDKTIVDTGTTDVRLPQRVFSGVQTLLAAAVADKPIGRIVDDGFFSGSKMICVRVGSMALLNSFPPIEFDLRHDDHRVIRLTLSSQQYLRFVGYNSGLERDCFKYGIQKSKIGTVLGSVLLEGFYVVYDRTNSRVGFAQSTCNYYGADVVNSSVSGPLPYSGSGTTLDCAFLQAPPRNMGLIEVISIVLGVLCLVIFIPIIVILMRMSRSQSRSQATTPSASDAPAPVAPPTANDRSHLLK